MHIRAATPLLALALACSRDKPPLPALTITELQPASGHPKGGNLVHVVGSGYNPRSTVEVRFGTKPARAIVVGPDRIQLEAPPGQPGEEVEVSVRFPDGRTGKAPQRYRWESALGTPDAHDHERDRQP